jgi:hypothetical protein
MSVRKCTTTKYIGENEHDGFEFTHEPIEDSLKIKKVKGGYIAGYLVQDSDPQSPEDNEDNELFLVGYHRDFTVDRSRTRYNKETQRNEVIDTGITKDTARMIVNGGKDENGELNEEAANYIKDYHIFGLEAYIHSGVVLALSHEGNFCDRQWDVSQLGLVFVCKVEWKSEKKARAAALSLIEDWNAYLSGDIYGIVFEDYNAKKEQIDHDSCWGYSSYEYAKEELADQLKGRELEVKK